MDNKLSLKEKYSLAGCCQPQPDQSIVGYFSFDDHIKVHRADCPNLGGAPPDRLVVLTWDEIAARPSFQPDDDYAELDATDFQILKHHQKFDIDYSLKVARTLNLPKQELFDRHQKLRNLGLLERVEALMVRYRKKTAKNKWIKHRNHTYYRLTPKGTNYLKYYFNRSV